MVRETSPYGRHEQLRDRKRRHQQPDDESVRAHRRRIERQQWNDHEDADHVQERRHHQDDELRERRFVCGVGHAWSPALPRAAGGTARATTPASATIVRTYGIISTNCAGTRCALCSWICNVSAPAKSRHAIATNFGSHRPKIVAASAMNPRPAVMLSVNWC